MPGDHSSPPPQPVAGARCSELSRAAREPPDATAPVAQGWLAIEQFGPWGHDAVSQSGLDPDLGRDLVRKTSAAGIRVVLIRRPGVRATTHQRRRVMLACTRPGATWLETFTVTDPAELRELDLSAAAGGADRPRLGPLVTEPIILVCTNAKRDQCCALRGRPLARDLGLAHPDAVWECSHLGGHRFAPTALSLPSGYVNGHLFADLGREMLVQAVAGRVVLPGLRGRSTWSQSGQMAEIAVRRATGELDADALSVDVTGRAAGEVTTMTVRHVDGRRWEVDIAIRTGPRARPESCGRDPTPVQAPYAAALRGPHERAAPPRSTTTKQ